jgi:hypothetical protein
MNTDIQDTTKNKELTSCSWPLTPDLRLLTSDFWSFALFSDSSARPVIFFIGNERSVFNWGDLCGDKKKTICVHLPVEAERRSRYRGPARGGVNLRVGAKRKSRHKRGRSETKIPLSGPCSSSRWYRGVLLLLPFGSLSDSR